jgi:hypothetical protein
MAKVVYVLCALLSLACAVFLVRGYAETRAKLLFWSSFCFVGLAVNSVMLFVDLVVFPAVDLSLVRSMAAVVGLGLLVFGLIWETV